MADLTLHSTPRLLALGIARQIFQERIAFNRLIGMEISLTDSAAVKVQFSMQPDLIGNFARGMLHGGVICSALDVVGGLAIFAKLPGLDSELSEEQLIAQFSQLGTIDLRVDFLRPGIGEYFVATANVLRTGSSVGVARMDLHNESGDYIAAGTGSYRTS